MAEKVQTLNLIKSNYNLPPELYISCKKLIQY